MRASVCFLALTGLATAKEAAAEAPRVRSLDIVDRAISFHGGELYRASATGLELCSKSGCYEISAVVDGGLFEYVVSGQVRGVERKVRSTNQSLELWEDGSPVAVDAEREKRLQDWVAARVYFCFLPFRLNDASALKQDLGLESWGERLLHKVKVTFSTGSSSEAEDEYLYWFDPQSGRVEQFAYSYAGEPGGLRFRRAFNYRRIGGLLFFDQENSGVEGNELALEELTPEVVEKMPRISTVELKNIRVRPLE